MQRRRGFLPEPSTLQLNITILRAKSVQTRVLSSHLSIQQCNKLTFSRKGWRRSHLPEFVACSWAGDLALSFCRSSFQPPTDFIRRCLRGSAAKVVARKGIFCILQRLLGTQHHKPPTDLCWHNGCSNKMYFIRHLVKEALPVRLSLTTLGSTDLLIHHRPFFYC